MAEKQPLKPREVFAIVLVLCLVAGSGFLWFEFVGMQLTGDDGFGSLLRLGILALVGVFAFYLFAKMTDR